MSGENKTWIPITEIIFAYGTKEISPLWGLKGAI